jgi:hypothetical protein
MRYVDSHIHVKVVEETEEEAVEEEMADEEVVEEDGTCLLSS